VDILLSSLSTLLVPAIRHLAILRPLLIPTLGQPTLNKLLVTQEAILLLETLQAPLLPTVLALATLEVAVIQLELVPTILEVALRPTALVEVLTAVVAETHTALPTAQLVVPLLLNNKEEDTTPINPLKGPELERTLRPLARIQLLEAIPTLCLPRPLVAMAHHLILGQLIMLLVDTTLHRLLHLEPEPIREVKPNRPLQRQPRAMRTMPS
jgi:hypothetical protein